MSYVLELLNSSGVKIAQLSDRECECTITRILNKEYSITITYPIPPTGPSKQEYFELFKVRARVTNLDDATDYQTFVLQQPEFKKNLSGATEIVCDGEHISIATMRNEIISQEIDFQKSSCTSVLTKIFSFSSYSIGTVSCQDEISIKISYESVLSALNKIVDLTNIDYEINEDLGTIDVSDSGGTDNNVRIKSGKNIKSISRKILNYDIVNKMYGVGGGTPPATIRGARHEVYSVDGGVVTLTNNKVVPDSGSWVGSYVSIKTGVYADSSFEIVASTHGETRDTITAEVPLPSLVAGDKIVIIARNALLGPNLYEVDYIEAATSIATYGELKDVYKNTKYGNIINLVNSPDMDNTYTSGLCAGWSSTGTPVLNEITQSDDPTVIKYGEKSQGVITGDSVSGIYQDVTVTTGRYYTVFSNVYVSSGIASFQITIGTKTYYINSASGETGWQTFKFDGMYGAQSTIRVAFMSVGTAQFFVDSVAVIESTLNENGTVDDRRFIKNCEQIDLWIETFDALMLKKDLRVEYKANFIDLYNIDNKKYSFDQISIGDIVTISDDEIGVDNIKARVTEIRNNPFRPETSEYTISTVV